MRLRDRGYSDTVTTAWGPLIIRVTMPEVVGKLQACGKKLTEWCKNSFGSVRKTLEEKRVLLSEAKLDAAIGGVSQLVKSLQKEINEILDKESQMWQQRSWSLFLKCKDRNTNYFHSKASQWFRRNRILGLKNNQNVWCTEYNQIKNIAVEYYQDLSHPPPYQIFQKSLVRSTPQ